MKSEWGDFPSARADINAELMRLGQSYHVYTRSAKYWYLTCRKQIECSCNFRIRVRKISDWNFRLVVYEPHTCPPETHFDFQPPRQLFRGNRQAIGTVNRRRAGMGRATSSPSTTHMGHSGTQSPLPRQIEQHSSITIDSDSDSMEQSSGQIKDEITLRLDPSLTQKGHELDSRGYKIIEPLGKGSMGVVIEVQHPSDLRTLARKQISKSDLQDPTQFHVEVETMRKAKHTHVVTVVDEYSDDDWYFIYMAPRASGNLEKYISQLTDIRLDGSNELWQEIARRRMILIQWVYCLAHTLADLHHKGIRHRDIKPTNILHHDGLIYFTDFGNSFSHNGDTEAGLTSTVGTLRYEPPEAISELSCEERNRVGYQGDVFSLGCVFLEMFEGIFHVMGLRFPAEYPPASPKRQYKECFKDKDFYRKLCA